MYSAFYVSQSKCVACNNQILKELGKLQGIYGIELDRIDGRIVVAHTEEVDPENIKQLLASLGLPELSNKEV